MPPIGGFLSYCSFDYLLMLTPSPSPTNFPVRLDADGNYQFYGIAPVDLAGTRLTCWHDCFLGPHEAFTPPQPLPLEDCVW